MCCSPARAPRADNLVLLLSSLAIDLELHRVPSAMPADERGQREVLNRLRTHIICYVIDRCFCINLGKPFMIPEDDVSRSYLHW